MSGIQPASLGQVSNALTLSIVDGSLGELATEHTAMKMQADATALIEKNASDAKTALHVSNTIQETMTIAGVLFVVAIAAMGLGGCLDMVGDFSADSLVGKGINIVKATMKPIEIAGFAGSAIAFGAEGYYQGKEAKLQGQISREKAASESIESDATAGLKKIDKSVRAQSELAGIAAAFITSNLSAKKAILT